MPQPHVSTNFGDLLDPRFQRIFADNYDPIPPLLQRMFSMVPTNGRNEMKFSQTGTLGDWTQFAGTVSYGSLNQGYDTTITPLEYTNGVIVERKLFNDDQYGIMDSRPKALARSATRTREKHGAGIWNNAFSVWSTFYNNTEGVSMCSNSHTTTSGASTNTGFDNLGTAALAATAVAAARIDMVDFRGDQAEKISVVPTELLYPPNLYEEAYEIINASGKVDGDLNNPNVHQGQYTGIEWNYLTDTNNWFLMDGNLRGEMVHWTDRVPMEFAFVEDFDTIQAKWRGYMRYALGHTDWRFIHGHQVS
jgi:phage major head subunit gpT-like protein